ncbi:MAG: TetR family transcriptional regulator [Rhodobacterales bacterium]|nr:TetR family transcriptional regulator [Rhodobacterales bacterium]
MNDSQSATSAPRGTDPAKRERFLAIAQRRFMEDGYARTSVSAIVREAGVAQGTFYLYFKNKEQLLGEMRRGLMGRYLQAFQHGIDTPGPIDERLVSGLSKLQRSVYNERALLRVFRQAATGDESEQQIHSARRALSRKVGGLIQAGVDSGLFTVDDANHSAQLMFSLIANHVADAVYRTGEADLTRHVEFATRFALRGLGVDTQRLNHLIPLTEDG